MTVTPTSPEPRGTWPAPGAPPLTGYTIGITADRRSEEQAQLLERRGARVLHGPTIATQYLGDEEALHAATVEVLARPPAYLIATTGIGVRAWFEAAQAWGLGDRLTDTIATAKVVARGAKAAATLEGLGIPVWRRPLSERLPDALNAVVDDAPPGARVAVQEHGASTRAEETGLAAAGLTVIAVPVYRWRLPDDDKAARRLIDAVIEGRVHAVTFTAAPAVTNLFTVAELTGQADGLRRAFNERGVVAACVGPVCAAAATAEGIDDPRFPDVGRLGLLVRHVTEELAGRSTTIELASGSLEVRGDAVVIDGDVIELAPKERAVLEALLERPGVVVSKQQLARGDGGGDDAERAAEATVSRLRRRLGPLAPSLVAIPRRGYRLVTADD